MRPEVFTYKCLHFMPIVAPSNAQMDIVNRMAEIRHPWQTEPLPAPCGISQLHARKYRHPLSKPRSRYSTVASKGGSSANSCRTRSLTQYAKGDAARLRS